jgi:hypothetical protein
MESPESKSPNGKNSLTESFNGPNGYHPFGGDGIEVKNYEGGTIDEGNTETIMKLKVLECVPPWQQDQFVPKGFKAEKFIRATGGGKGSDRGALSASNAEDEDSPVVFNAPMNCVPPWKLDQQGKQSVKVLKPEDELNDESDEGLTVKDRMVAQSVPVHSHRPYGTHDEMFLQQDMKREEKRASGKSSAASWSGEVSKPPWAHSETETIVESDADRAAILVSTLAAATAHAQALDEDLAAAEEFMRVAQLKSAALNAELVKFAVALLIIEAYILEM